MKGRPQFESKRFLMRPLRASDYPAWYAAQSSVFPKVNEFDLEKKTLSELSRSEFKKYLKKDAKLRADNLVCQFGVFEKKTGRLMGFVLYALFLRMNVQSARIAYHMYNNYWKHGYGKEAVSAAVDYAFKKLKLHRLEAEIRPNNRASMALAKGLGFQSEGNRRGAVYFSNKWHDMQVFALLAEDRGIKNTKPKILR